MFDRQLDIKEHVAPQLARQPAEAQQGHQGEPAASRHSVLQLQRLGGNRFVQRMMAMFQAASERTEAPENVEQAIQRRRGGGQPLDHAVQTQMEASIGADFSKVGLHTDAEADGLNRALQARAFTTGQDVFFRQGAYDPGSSSGRELLAHELTHVVQQGGGSVQRKLVVGQPGDRYEQEADAVAHAVMQQEQQGNLRRQPEEDKEEEPLGRQIEGAPLQRQPEDEKEEAVQARMEQGLLQRQTDQEDEALQAQWAGVPVQTQGEQEEQEEQTS